MEFDPSDLHLLQYKSKFQEPTTDENITSKHPDSIAEELSAHMLYLRKLKFRFLEQSAKDKYITAILGDATDTPLVTNEANEQLREVNKQKKVALRDAKAKLQEKYNDISLLAPLLEEDLLRAQRQAAHLNDLAARILDKKLALSRIQLSHPAPRLTIASANALYDANTEEMQRLDESASDAQERVAGSAANVKAATKELERLNVERTALEKDAGNAKDKDASEDPRILDLYNWYTESLALHKHASHLVSSVSATENSLHLHYLLPITSLHPPTDVYIRLIFHPNTTNLADAQVHGAVIPEDGAMFAELLEVHRQMGDAHGFVRAVLARVHSL